MQNNNDVSPSGPAAKPTALRSRRSRPGYDRLLDTEHLRGQHQREQATADATCPAGLDRGEGPDRESNYGEAA